jgi:hypothetical protein
MKTFVKAVTIAFLLLTVSCSETVQNVKETETNGKKEQFAPEATLYTAYNIWKVRKLMLRRCINYKHGYNIIPAGTEVRKAKIANDRNGNTVIKFITANDNREYNIYFKSKWHPGKTIEDYLGYMFTTKTFEESTAGMTETEIEAIRKGIILNGMSKEAVLICYGYPPEHRTRSLDSNVWVYWKNKLTSFDVCFDKEDRTTNCR